MAKSGNNENKIEKLVRVGFYELEKTIGKGRKMKFIIWLQSYYLIKSNRIVNHRKRQLCGRQARNKFHNKVEGKMPPEKKNEKKMNKYSPTNQKLIIII